MSRSVNLVVAVSTLVVSLGTAAGLAPALGTPIHVEMTTSNGVVPGTSIAYTIGITGDNGGPRNIFPGATSDNGTWHWQNGFPEFLSFGQAEELTVTFNAPVPVSDVVLGLNSTSASTSALTVGGGTASTLAFNLTDGLAVYNGPTGTAAFNPSTGVITAAGQKSVHHDRQYLDPHHHVLRSECRRQ